MSHPIYKTNNDLDDKLRSQMIALLNQQLADTFDLFSQIKQAHWNVKGMDFIQLHELFDDLAEQTEGYVDLIAERATTLGGTALGTVRMSAAASRLAECHEQLGGSKGAVEVLVDRYANVAKTTREAIDTSAEAGDADTADLFTEVSRGLDKGLWFLEAHLQS
ncbi:MAG: DNA starvation/stationary phase protection protein Dps [Burkholderiales bacterium]